MAQEHRPGQDEEREHYLTHENDPADAGYRAFLQRLAGPLVRRLPAGARGLDYGSGPGPTLSVLLQEQGFHMTLYDPFFAPEKTALQTTYDFITCTETAEHFFQPHDEFQRLHSLLRPGAYLAVMTQMVPGTSPPDLAAWRYARDPTHVCFYRLRTMEWLAHRFDWSLHLPHPNVAIFRNKPG